MVKYDEGQKYDAHRDFFHPNEYQENPGALDMVGCGSRCVCVHVNEIGVPAVLCVALSGSVGMVFSCVWYLFLHTISHRHVSVRLRLPARV